LPAVLQRDDHVAFAARYEFFVTHAAKRYRVRTTLPQRLTRWTGLTWSRPFLVSEGRTSRRRIDDLEIVVVF
jgi:hypothetical protein